MTALTVLLRALPCALASAAVLAASPGAPAPSAAALTSALDKPLKDIASGRTDSLHLTVASGETAHDKQLHWLTWDERSAQGSLARLALLGHDAKAATAALAIIERSDAYAPAFLDNLPWRYGQHPVRGWTYMQGATVQTLELYGLTEQRQPIKLAELSGMAIGWSINTQGKFVVNVYDQNTPKHPSLLSPTCYTWQEQSHTLRPSSCR